MSDPQVSRVGSMFGPYHLKRLLGRGGMGEVYEAEHTVKEWPCAVKLMSETFSKDAVSRERMKREARITGRLQEPHVVPIHDYGEIDGQMFLEMRLIEGTDLDNLLKRYGPLTPPRAVAIITQVASALDAAHAAGVMHRDVKPQNILVTHDDFAYLVDFGIASASTDEKLTQLGTAVGTWKYMAPERFSDAEVTPRADIYSLACVLHECLTGSPPYRSDSASMLISAHLMEPIPQPSAVRPGIPKAFDAVIARGMAKRPEDRYATAGDLALAAHEALSDPDQDRAANIVRRSQEATLPGSKLPPPAATLPGTAMGAPSDPGPTVTTPPSTPVSPQYPHPASPGPGPRQGPGNPPPPGRPAWAPDSGPASTPRQPISQHYQGSSSWAGTPPATPPPSGPTPWGQPPPGTRNPWPIVAGAAVLVLVLVAGAIGIWILTHQPGKTVESEKSSTSTTTTRTTTTPTTTPTTNPTTPVTGPQSKLLAMLPEGYPSGICRPVTPKSDTIWADAVAMVECDQNTMEGGPSQGIYGLFANPTVLSKAFNADIQEVQMTDCPGGGRSPSGWHRNDTPTVTAGMIACGTYKNHPNVVWSNESKVMLSDVFGDPPALEDLYTWWKKNG